LSGRPRTPTIEKVEPKYTDDGRPIMPDRAVTKEAIKKEKKLLKAKNQVVPLVSPPKALNLVS